MDCPLVMIGVNKGCRYYEIGEEIILRNGRNLFLHLRPTLRFFLNLLIILIFFRLSVWQ